MFCVPVVMFMFTISETETIDIKINGIIGFTPDFDLDPHYNRENPIKVNSRSILAKSLSQSSCSMENYYLDTPIYLKTDRNSRKNNKKYSIQDKNNNKKGNKHVKATKQRRDYENNTKLDKFRPTEDSLHETMETDEKKSIEKDETNEYSNQSYENDESIGIWDDKELIVKNINKGIKQKIQKRNKYLDENKGKNENDNIRIDKDDKKPKAINKNSKKSKIAIESTKRDENIIVKQGIRPKNKKSSREKPKKRINDKLYETVFSKTLKSKYLQNNSKRERYVSKFKIDTTYIKTSKHNKMITVKPYFLTKIHHEDNASINYEPINHVKYRIKNKKDHKNKHFDVKSSNYSQNIEKDTNVNESQDSHSTDEVENKKEKYRKPVHSSRNLKNPTGIKKSKTSRVRTVDKNETEKSKSKEYKTTKTIKNKNYYPTPENALTEETNVKSDEVFTNPQLAQDNKVLRNFTNIEFNKYLQIIDEVTNVADDTEKYFLENLKYHYFHKFKDYINNIRNKNIVDRRTAENVIIKSINISGDIIKKFIDENDPKIVLRSDSSVNTLRRKIRNEVQSEMDYICKIYNICGPPKDFASHLIDVIELLLKSDEYKFIVTYHSIIEVIKTSYNKVLPVSLHDKFRKVLQNIKNQEPTLTRKRFKMFGKIITNRNNATSIKAIVGVKDFENILAFLEIVEYIDRKLPQDGVEKVLWQHFKNDLKDYLDGSRYDILPIVNMIIKHIKNTLIIDNSEERSWFERKVSKFINSTVFKVTTKLNE